MRLVLRRLEPVRFLVPIFNVLQLLHIVLIVRLADELRLVRHRQRHRVVLPVL